MDELDESKELLEQSTLSIGMFEVPYNLKLNKQQVSIIADNALYKSKTLGKNTVILKEFNAQGKLITKFVK